MTTDPMQSPLNDFLVIVNKRLHIPIIGDEHRLEVLQLADGAFLFNDPTKRDTLRVIKSRYTPDCVSP